MRETGQVLAVAAGMCASGASLFAKLAMEASTLGRVCPVLLNSLVVRLGFAAESGDNSDRPVMSMDAVSLTAEEEDCSAWAATYCQSMLVLIRGLCFALVFLANSLMWTLFIKSLDKSRSSVVATVTNTASNFFFTAVSGWVVFSEELPILWWIGATLIVTGLLVIHASSSSPLSPTAASSSSPASMSLPPVVMEATAKEKMN